MFCPQCRAEYREGFTECADCQVPLVSELPPLPPEPDPEYVDYVTVLEIANPAALVVAKSMLEGADIPYFAKGEGVQSLFGAGAMGTGFNTLTGPVELQVEKDRVEEAAALLEELEEEVPPLEDEDEEGDFEDEDDVEGGNLDETQ